MDLQTPVLGSPSLAQLSSLPVLPKKWVMISNKVESGVLNEWKPKNAQTPILGLGGSKWLSRVILCAYDWKVAGLTPNFGRIVTSVGPLTGLCGPLLQANGTLADFALRLPCLFSPL